MALRIPTAVPDGVHVISDLTNRCLIVYRSESDGPTYSTYIKHVRDFPPRRTYPIAIVTMSGQVIRLTADPLPPADVLEQHIRALRKNPLPAPNWDAEDTEPASFLNVTTVIAEEDTGQIFRSPNPFAQSTEGDAAQEPLEEITLEQMAKTLAGNGTTVVAIDTSGTLGLDRRCRQWAEAFEALPNTHVVAFGLEVSPFSPDDPLPAAAGTSFQALLDYVEERQPEAQNVVVMTDGYGAHISPRQPERWTWVLTPGGDPWPARRTRGAMRVYVTD